MRMKIALACLTACSPCCFGEVPAVQSSLRYVTTIELKAVEGRIDHMAVDRERQRLYVAALGNNTVEVLDLKEGKQVGRIDGLKKPQGVAVIPVTGEFVVASGDDGKCRKYSSDRKLLGTIDGLDDADNVRFDAAAKLIYVGYGDGALAVISADKFNKIADIKLAGHPESFQLEAQGKRIFVNVPDAGHVAVVDREKRQVTEKWSIDTAKANFPMAVDEVHHRLFVGCRRPAKLLVIDTDSGKTLSAHNCCGDTDDLFYDKLNQRIYVVGGSGKVDAFNQVDADNYKLAEQITTAPGARTAYYSADLNRLFVAVPRRSGQTCEIRVFQSPAPK